MIILSLNADGSTRAQTGKPLNLLDNSDFRAGRVVNQRGQTSYSANFAGIIDRWYISSGSNDTSITASVQITSAGLSLSKASNGNVSLYQRLEPNTLADGKTYTAVMCKIDGKLLFGTVTNHASAMGFWQIEYHINDSVTVAWAALYEGVYTVDTLPPYVYKGYAAELAECQRYYVRGTKQLARPFAPGSVAYLCEVSYPVQMRINPTVSAKNIIRWVDQTPAAIAAAKNVGDANGFNSINLSATYGDAILQFDYEASAEL